jgi:hypothetical protein
MLYLASDQPLPLIERAEANQSFSLTNLGEREVGVRGRFSESNVYAAGAHEGCGCGFQLGQYPGQSESERSENARSLAQLADYMDDQLAAGAQVSLFACWAGDYDCPAESVRSISTNELRGEVFFFIEKQLVQLCGAEGNDVK